MFLYRIDQIAFDININTCTNLQELNITQWLYLGLRYLVSKKSCRSPKDS